MTECERIIKSGRITEEFLQPEYRCGYYVDGQMKKIWAVEFDLYLEFERVCKKHDLKFFMFTGSLLGTVRHSGFIPWDDDIDVAMFREDYDKLLALAYEFKEPYFLQTPITDKYCGYSIAKLRNSNTCASIEKFKYSKMNQGIFIDIFPIDKVDMRTVERDCNTVTKLAYENSTYMRLDHPMLDAQDRERVQMWSGASNIDIYNEIQSICKRNQKSETKEVALLAFNAYGYKRQTYMKESFNDLLWKKFEDRLVPIPCGFEDILTRTYGDYRIFPPMDERKPVHNSYFKLDPDVSYKIVEEIL